MRKGIDYTGVGVCVLCHDGNGRYLVGQRSDQCRDEHFTWHPIGSGSVEPHEMLEDAVRREVKEEVGAAVKGIELLGFRESDREQNGEYVHWIHFDYLALVDPKEVSIMEPDMCLALKWCAIDEIPEPRHSKFPEYVDKYGALLRTKGRTNQ